MIVAISALFRVTKTVYRQMEGCLIPASTGRMDVRVNATRRRQQVEGRVQSVLAVKNWPRLFQ
jgi:hypothetical protein